MNNENKKRVLLTCPAFRGYGNAMRLKLQEMGYEVTFFHDMPQAKWYKALINYPSIRVRLQFLLHYFEWNNENRILKSLKGIKFDYVIIIKGAYLSSSFYKNLKLKNPNAKFVMYQWDSHLNYGKFLKKDFLSFQEFFDRMYTFDRKDSEKIKNLRYLPLFYIDDYAIPESEEPNKFDCDLFFIGGNHRNRFGVLEKIYENTNHQNIKSCFLLLGGEVREKTTINGLKFINKPLSHKEIIEYLKKSNVVIDIHSEKQDGLTIRCFEALAFGRKLATTNALIAQEPFYKPDNIHIIDLENPSIPLEFIKKEVEPLDMSAYSLESFLKNLINN